MHKDIHIGGDPRNYLEFSEIRNEINKLNHPAAPEVDFLLIVTCAKELFSRNGMDLQTVNYFIFAQTKLKGLSAVKEGCELLAVLITRHWQQLWPEGETARIEMLNWLANRISDDVRTFAYTTQHIPLLIELEQPLHTIADGVKALLLKKEPAIIDLYNFVHHTRETLEKRAATNIINERKRTRQTRVVEQPAELKLQPVEALVVAEAPVVTAALPVPEIPPLVIAPLPEKLIPRLSAWHGFFMGVGTSALVFLTAVVLFQQPNRALMEPQLFSPLSSQEIVEYASQLHAIPFWQRQPDFQVFQQQLTQLSQASPVASYFYGDNLTALMAQLWPDSKKVAAMDQRWQQRLAQQRAVQNSAESWLVLQQQVSALIRQVNQAQVRGSTLSDVRLLAGLNTIQRQLNDSHLPVESLILMQADATERDAIQLEHIEQRINGLLSRYHALITDGKQ